MSFKSVLDKIGADAKDVFQFLASPKGQAAVGAGELAVEAFVPGSAGVITLVNAWAAEVLKAQALATAAGATTAAGPQKAALVLNAVTPDALAFAKVNGLPAPTADKLATANAALVAFLDAFTATATPAATPAGNS